MRKNVQFVNNSKKVKALMDASVIAALYTAAGEVQAQAVHLSPNKSGQLRNSWSYVVDEEKQVAYVGSNLENAIWNEFGTGEFALNGDGRKGGWYYQDEKGNWHHTYGKPPQRTLFRAFLNSQNIVKGIFERELRNMNASSKSKAQNTKSFDLKDLKKSFSAGKDLYKKITNPQSLAPKIKVPKVVRNYRSKYQKAVNFLKKMK